MSSVTLKCWSSKGSGILGVDRNCLVVKDRFTHPDIYPLSGACGGSKGDFDGNQKGRDAEDHATRCQSAESDILKEFSLDFEVLLADLYHCLN
jgi:hypothetical protein